MPEPDDRRPEALRSRTLHDIRVQSEFARQAESFAASRILASGELTAAITGSLGEAARGRILDLAAGPGLMASALAGKAREVVAIDLTAETLVVARTRLDADGQHNVRLVRGNGLVLPFGESCFDAAVIRLALHHLQQPQHALREAHHTLRDGGVIAVLDLVAPEAPADALILTALEQLRDPSHVRALRASELRTLVVEAGFEPTHERSFSLERHFAEWAAIIKDPVRMSALEVVMRELASRGVHAGIGLREDATGLLFDYTFSLVIGRRR